MVRPEIKKLVSLGTFPPSNQVDAELVKSQESLLREIQSPISDDEARLLLRLFGPDDYFGLAWTILHLVESAPSWPITASLSDAKNEWILRLKERAARGQRF